MRRVPLRPDEGAGVDIFSFNRAVLMVRFTSHLTGVAMSAECAIGVP